MLENLTESYFSKKFLRIYVFTQILLVACAGFAFYRYYWLHSFLLLNFECFSVSTVTLTLLWITLSALWRGHRTDPGFVTQKKSEDGTLCQRCDVYKPSESTHHCSNCKKCVLDMDHHCFLMDNCVGKHSVRFFVQYSTWMSVLLVWAIAVYIKGFYYQNTVTGKGVKNLLELRPDYVLV